MAKKLIDSLRQRFKVAPGEHVGIKQSVGKVEVDGVSGTITAIANTSSVDFDNEVVIPEGCEMDADGKPVYISTTKAILWCHDMNLPPIGTMRNATLRAGKWVTQFSMSKSEFGQDIATLIGEGCVNGTSIGFIRKDGGRPTEKEIALYGLAEYVTRAWRWLELSVTPFPCNPEALIQGGKSMRLPVEFSEKAIKAAERHAISSKTLNLLGCQPARPKRIVIFSSNYLTPSKVMA